MYKKPVCSEQAWNYYSVKVCKSMRLLQLSADLKHADLFVMELNVLRASIFNTEGKISDLCKSKHV